MYVGTSTESRGVAGTQSGAGPSTDGLRILVIACGQSPALGSLAVVRVGLATSILEWISL